MESRKIKKNIQIVFALRYLVNPERINQCDYRKKNYVCKERRKIKIRICALRDLLNPKRINQRDYRQKQDIRVRTIWIRWNKMTNLTKMDNDSENCNP